MIDAVKNEFVMKLSKDELKKFRALSKEISGEPIKSQKAQLLDVFIPQIKKKSEEAAKDGKISAADYFQELCLRFLEYIEKAFKTKQPVHNMLRTLNKEKPSADDVISKADIVIEEISPKEEFNNLSYKLDDETDLDKASQILKILKQHLPEKKTDAMKLFLDGFSFEEIGKELDISTRRAMKIYYEFVHKVKDLNGRGLFNNIVFEDTQNQELIVSHKMPAKHEKLEPKKIWKEAKSSYSHWDTLKELDSMMRTQTTSKELMQNKSSQTKLRKKLEQNPDFKIRLELNMRCNNPKFKREAAQISTELFGKNIFEFLS